MLALTTHAREVPMAERLAFAGALRELAGDGLVIETCHRVEGYLPETTSLADSLRAALPAGGRELRGEAAIRHAVSVAVGRDSVVQGEDQIVHQLRAAMRSAQATRRVDPVVERIFASAVHAGRLARSWRQGPTRSLATLALEVLAERAGPLEGKGVLVVGAGRMGRLVAQAAHGLAASVDVASRSPARAEGVARPLGVRAVALDPGPVELAGITGVVVALGGPWNLGAASVRALAASEALIVDLSVPAALPAEMTGAVPRDRLVGADDLARLEHVAGPGDAIADARIDRLIEETTREVQAWLDGHARRAAAAALTERSDDVRAAALAGLWRDLPDLDPDTREAIDQMTRHLAQQLLREPLERLGRDVDGHTESAVREVFAL